VIAVSERLTVIEHDGKIKYSVRLAPEGTWGGAHRGASVADLDGDGELDIAYLMDDGVFGVRRGRDGKVLWRLEPSAWCKKPISQNSNGPVLADLTGDGKLDAFFIVGKGSSRDMSGNYGYAVCVTGFEGRGPGWMMLRHDARNSGNFHTPLSPALRRNLSGLKTR
jgi:hypothetical protein